MPGQHYQRRKAAGQRHAAQQAFSHANLLFEAGAEFRRGGLARLVSPSQAGLEKFPGITQTQCFNVTEARHTGALKARPATGLKLPGDAVIGRAGAVAWFQ